VLNIFNSKLLIQLGIVIRIHYWSIIIIIILVRARLAHRGANPRMISTNVDWMIYIRKSKRYVLSCREERHRLIGQQMCGLLSGGRKVSRGEVLFHLHDNLLPGRWVMH
jgi:hypothetical protein